MQMRGSALQDRSGALQNVHPLVGTPSRKGTVSLLVMYNVMRYNPA